jgi:hypothetical protein
MVKKTVVLSFLFYPMAIGRYFEAALKRHDDINLITVGPYYGNMIPWNNWMALRQKDTDRCRISFRGATGKGEEYNRGY